MKKSFIALCAFILLSTHLMASPLVTLSGSTLSGFSGYKQQKGQPFRGQFENAANVLVGIELSEQVSAQIDMGFGITPNQSGFTDGADLAGLSISIAPQNFYNTAFTLGSVSVPYGQFSQTDNANIGHYFIYNDLGFSLLRNGSSTTDFGSNGAMVSTDFSKNGAVDVLVFNGTDDTATNTDQGVGVAFRYTNDALINNVAFSFSALNVNDSGNVNALNANTTAFMGDVKTAFQGVELGGYVSMITLDDGNSATKDNVTAYMAYASKRFSKFTLSGRYSVVSPEDFDGNGTGGTSAMPIVGLGNVPFADVDTTRIQTSAIFHLEDNLNIHNEIIFDTYGENRTDYNNTAVLSYASITF